MTSRLALSIDLEACIGCKSCEAACKQEHGLGPNEYRNKVMWLERIGEPKVDLLTVTCQHCERPACLRACPVNPKAIVKDPDTGVVSILEDRCTGCGECVLACPYGAMGYDPKDHHAVKCDLCAERRKRDEIPACASVCPTRAIQFSSHDDHIARAERDGRQVVDHDHFLLGPATVYLDGQSTAADAAKKLPTHAVERRPLALLTDPSTRRVLQSAELSAPYRVEREQRQPDRVVPGGCNICFNGCPIKFHLRDDQIVGISGNELDPIFEGRICPKSQMTLQMYNNDRRLTEPLKRIVEHDGSVSWQPVSWQQALDEIAAKLTHLRAQHGSETLAIFSGTRSGIITNRGYIRLFGQLWGTPNIESTEPFCSSSKNLALGLIQGERALANSYTPTDIGSAELFVYIGDNQAETRPVYFGMVSEWRRRSGARMIAVDPRLSATANKADEWLPIRSGTDLALGLAIIHHIFANELHDRAYCEAWVLGWEKWRDFVLEKAYTPEWAAAITDLPAERIIELAQSIARADGCMIFASRGVNQHTNGTQTNRVYMFIAAMTGNWGRRGGGYFNMATSQPINPNVPAERRAPIERPRAGISPTSWLGAMTDAHPYPISALIASNNPFSNWPGQEATRAALKSLELYVQLALFWNASCEAADYVLPVASGIEKGGITRGADERRIVWNDPIIEPPGNAKPDGWIWIELGKRLGYDDVLKEEYKEIDRFWDEVCLTSPNLRGCTTERFRAQPTRTLRTPLPDPDAPVIETLFADDDYLNQAPNRFPTASGKLEFWTPDQETKFAAMGLSAMPEFYSEAEHLVDLPYVEPDKTTMVMNPLADTPTYGHRARIVETEIANAQPSPGSVLRAQGFDTELITGRPPAAHYHSWTHDFWQAQEMWPDLYVQMHTNKAAALGIDDGDRVRVETSSGAVEGRAWIREGIRENAVFVPIGWDEKQPYNPWRPANYLSDPEQRDPFADQTNLKSRLCRVSRASPWRN